MHGEYRAPSSKSKNPPEMDAECSANLTRLKTENSAGDAENPSRRKSNPVKRCILLYTLKVMFVVSILCFSVVVVYFTVDSGYFRKSGTPSRANNQEDLVAAESLSNSEYLNLYQYVYRDRLRDLSSQLRSIILRIDQRRLKRAVDATPCSQKVDNCREVIDSMWSIVSIVNNSMPHLQAFLRNVSASPGDGGKSKFVELVACLQCKNDSITFIDDTGPADLNDDRRIIYEHCDHEQIKNNVDVISSLLSDRDGNSNDVEGESSRVTETPSIFETTRTEDGTTKELGTSTVETAEFQSTSAETEPANETGSASTITASTTSGMAESDGTTDSWVTMNVTEIVNTVVHPWGQGPDDESRQSAGEGENGARGAEFRSMMHGRILSNPSGSANPGTIPTAETMKSSQQLQLNPTMSWMPYQVCFYGPQANGQGKQSAPGQFMYPASGPGVPFPTSMPNRQGFQNQAPNFVQVQANSVQFGPMQPFQANNRQSGVQRVGPTGPGMPNIPPFPGHQSGPSGGPSPGPSNKFPYYCTYIPAPTFQFPTIPGVSEYQRSSNAAERSEKSLNILQGNETAFNRFPLPEYLSSCPPNMIRCADGRSCILRSRWCNGEVDCNDASDERTCSCRDRISQERLCDGYFDCPHGEDELGCLGCPKTFFSCDDWKRRYTTENCVPFTQRCDGLAQCANGKDEMDCSILTPLQTEGKNVFTVGYTEGFLHKNFKGQWYPVCTAVDTWAKDACASEAGPHIGRATPEVKIHPIPVNAYSGPYLAEVNGHTEIVPSCKNTAVYVRCPRFPCGTRVISRQDLLRPYALDKENQNSVAPLEEILWRYLLDRKNFTGAKNDTDIDDFKEFVSFQMRVVGGRASRPKAWPFLVAVYRDGVFYCGGVILNELWIITAAHCLNGHMGHYYEIQAGMLRRLSFSPMTQYRKARYTVVHPHYSSTDMSSDIGMIMLDDPLRFNRWVRPACLPGPDILGPMWRDKPDPDTVCVAIGWGVTREQGPDPDHMREVELPILGSCKHPVDQHEATICAGYRQGGRDACQGDSGGPLMCRSPYSALQWYVAGIISHGEGCARPNEPGTYTKVSYFLNWIQDISTGRGVPPLRRTPLERCPGFSCEGGLGKCLPSGARCNKIVDCLDGEDEANCYEPYPLYGKDIDMESSQEVANFTVFNNARTADARFTYNAPDQSSEEDKNNEVESAEDDTVISTTSDPNSSFTTTGPPRVFTCTRLLQTISIDQKCDKVADCEDGTDEMNCTCRDYLTRKKPSVICDGYTDCADLTDEQGCVICKENEFYCRRSNVCISKSKKCDARFDCQFKEDELDCFTLSDGKQVYLDADNQPYLNAKGILTRYVDGNWQPTCHNARIHQNQSTATIIGKNMCEYFGFATLESSKASIVRNAVLNTIPWARNNSTPETDSSAASLEDEEETCPGLYIQCTPILSGNVYTYYRDNVEQWPWIAAIYVDGEFRCTGLLLDRNWLLAASKCVQDIRLEKNYTAADLGYDITLRDTVGPHQQTIMIDEMHFVNDSVAVLLHMESSVQFSRQVRPVFLDKKIYPQGVQDTCEAVGTNGDETRSVLVRPILKNCSSCQRCFANVSSNECWESATSEWTGTIFCRGKAGWYPAAVFQNNRGLCRFMNSKTVTSIDYINPYLTEIADSPRKPSIFDASACDGVRCRNGKCVPRNRVCDGVPDCRDRDDEDPKFCKNFRQNCRTTSDCACTRTELRCEDGSCVDKSAFCDGQSDCLDGSDEPVVCTCAEYLRLIMPERLCDGVRHCLDKTDESPTICPCSDTSFRCEKSVGNSSCVPQDFVCDGDRDCLDGEDEAQCKMLKQFSGNSSTSGEVITRSYGFWHSECLPNPLSSDEEASNLCRSMGYSSGYISNATSIIDDPSIIRLDSFYIVKINNWTWMSLRNDKPLVTLETTNETCHRAFVDCV